MKGMLDFISNNTKQVDPASIMAIIASRHGNDCGYDEEKHIWYRRSSALRGGYVYRGILRKIAPLFPSSEEQTGWMNGGSSKEDGIELDRICEALINEGQLEVLTDQHRQRLPTKVLRFFDKLKHMHIEPFRAEVNVVSHSMKAGARIDVLARRFVGSQSEKLVLVERKSGYRYANQAHSTTAEKMNAPLDTIPNTPVNRHHIQLFAQKQILEKEYGIKVDEAYLIYTDALGGCEAVELMTMPDELKQKLTEWLTVK